MAPSAFKLTNGWLTTSVAWKGRQIPMPIRFNLTSKELPVAKEITRRIEREAVQERLVKYLGVGGVFLDKISGVSVSTDYANDCITVDKDTFQIQISYDEARSLHGNKVVVVLSGGSDRALSHVGVLLALEEAGVHIDYVIGTSGGSIIAALYALMGDAKKVQQAIKKVIQEYSYQDLLDLDLVRLRDNPSTVSGLIAGNRLIHAIKKAGVGDSHFSDTLIKLAIIGSDIESCTTYVFGDHKWLSEELSVDPSALRNDVYPRSMHQLFPDPNPRIAEDAIRSSISIPIAFSTNDLSYNGANFRLIDGGTGDNCSIITAANITDVGTVYAVNLGYPETSKDQLQKTAEKESRESYPLFKDPLRLVDYIGLNTLKLTLGNAELLRGLKSVRVINPGILLPTPKGFVRAQDTMISTMETFRKVHRILTPTGFLKKFDNQKIELVKKSGFSVKIYSPNSPNSNVVMVRDLNPVINLPANSPIMSKLREADGGEIHAKVAVKSAKKWLLEDAMQVWGKIRFSLAGIFMGIAAKLIFREKKIPKQPKTKEEK